MFTKALRKIASKIVMATLLFSVVSPLTNQAYALNGTLSVGFNHLDGGFEVYNVFDQLMTSKDGNDCTDPGNGYLTCEVSLPTGFYTVKFTDVPNWDKPNDVDIQLSELGGEVLGDYVPQGNQQNGVLGVAVNHIDGGFQVFDVNQQEVANKDATQCGPENNGWYVCQLSLPTGFYEVQFKDVNGFVTPQAQDIQLSQIGGTIWGTYAPNAPNNGTLNVGINHVDGGFQIFDVYDQEVTNKDALDCGPSQPNGYFVCQQSLPTGFYTVKFKDVTGFNTPIDVDVQLSEQGGTVWGNYTPQGNGNGLLTVAMNHVSGGYKIFNVYDNEVADQDAANCGPDQNGWYFCDQSLPTGFYTVKFKNVQGYITPGDIDVQLSENGGTVWGYYAAQPSGVVQVSVVDENDNPILNLPANEWELQKCASADPGSCFQTMGSGGPGDLFVGLDYSFYRIVFPSPQLPQGYTGRTVLPNVYLQMDANNTFLSFTIKYTKESQVNQDPAFVNVRTTPVMANTRMVTLDPPQPNQEAVTSDLVNGVPTYDLSDPNRFTLPTTNGSTAATDYYIECLPAPGGFHAPANPIQINNAVYAAGSENLAGTCQYTAVPNNEKVTISIDTIGVEFSAIYVDNVEVRATNNDAEVFVDLTTTEEHTISFEDKDPQNFITPPDIVLPANSLNSNMTPDELKYLGYYVAIGNLATAEMNTENQNGWAYISIGADPTKWNVGYADTTANPLIVHFDETVDHEFHYEDKNLDNPNYFLRAVPIQDAGFSVSQDITLNGSDVTYFQERYTYSAPQALDTVYLTGDYIAGTDAAFFRAKTTNANPVFGEIYLDINNEATETLIPGANTFTRIFISDVVNDQDSTSFESPINVNATNYTAVPASYDLSTFNPGPTINDLLSTYVPGTSDVTIQLVSLDQNVQPSAGLTVTMDNSVNEQTVDNAGDIEAYFVSVDQNQAHDFVCPAINGLAPPNDIHVPANTLQPGENVFHCLYAPLATAAEIQIETEAVDNTDLEAPITLNVDGTPYNLGWTVNDLVPNTPATLELWIDSAVSNTIIYGDVPHNPAYILPANDVVNVVAGSSYQNTPANIFNGFYDLPQQNGATLNFHLRELDPDDGVVANTNVTVNAVVQQSDGNGDASFNNVDVNQAITVTFGDHPLGQGAYATPLPLNFQSGELNDGQTYDFTIYYVPVAFAVTLDVNTLDEPTQLINVNGMIQLIVNGGQPTLYGFGNASIIVSNDPQFSYMIDWGPTSPASQYIEPAVDPLAVDVSNLNAGQHQNVTGLYRLCQSGNCEVVTITAYDQNNQILNSATIFVNGQPVGNGQHIGTYDVGSVLNIQFEDVPTHGVPEIFWNNVSQGFSHTTQYTVLDGPSTNIVDAHYPLDGNTVGFNVGTRDDQSNPLTEDITHGPTGTETTEATPAFFAVDQGNLNSYIINFADKPGYITPGSVTVTNGAIATIPNNVLITNNGTPYVAGDPLQIGDTYDIMGTYIPFFTIEKNITNEQVIANNNKRVDYQIVVTRHPDTAPGQMTISLHDTLSDNNRTLSGSNGGVMNTVPQNGVYSVCSNGCGDITAGPVNVTIDNPGNSVTITYQLLSTNTGIPANQSSTFTNTLTGTFDDNGNQVQITTNANVIVAAPPGGTGCGTNCGSTGGGGGGGGQILIKGDMILEVTKLVSLDNKTWVDASDEDNPLTIPKNIDSTLFTKVNVKNLGQVSATNIKYSEGFDPWDAQMSSDDIQNVQGDEGVSYNDVTGVITIDKIIVGGEKNFSYEQIIHENGTQGELAEEYLVLDGFSTTLNSAQDGLTKHGVGDHFPSWLTAGKPTTVSSEGSLLELSIETDKAAAKVGEEVTYTITAKNNADFDLTGLIITWDYDENALEILNPYGGNDTGIEIHWNQGTLAPGESAQYQVRTRVSDGAPVGGNVRTTARGLVNELEDPAYVEHFLTIIAGIGPGPVKLAQTGMPTFVLILASLLAYLGYTQTGRRRYLALKKAALKPF